MELKELRSLVALSELGSIALVADYIHLSPPAIHKQLKTLEAELGVTLYEKAGKKLQLTQAATVLLPHVKELLAHYDFALGALDEWKGLKRGLVRIGTGPSSYVLPAILKHFRHAYPKIEVLVETANTPALLEELQKGSLDLALVVSADLSERHDFVIEATWDFEMILVSQFKHLPQRPHLADLRERRFILFRQGSRMQEPIDRYFTANMFEPKVVMRFDNAEFIRSMVQAGLGIALLPLWVVRRDLKERHLSMIRPIEATPFSKIALIRRQSSYIPRPVEGFIQTASALVSKDVPLLTISRPPTSLNSRKVKPA
jgi:DNA-binding transcriptional LysR family regulator